jgi:hypothetical protein
LFSMPCNDISNYGARPSGFGPGVLVLEAASILAFRVLRDTRPSTKISTSNEEPSSPHHANFSNAQATFHRVRFPVDCVETPITD